VGNQDHVSYYRNTRTMHVYVYIIKNTGTEYSIFRTYSTGFRDHVSYNGSTYYTYVCASKNAGKESFTTRTHSARGQNHLWYNGNARVCFIHICVRLEIQKKGILQHNALCGGWRSSVV